jgi:hypothetical protein
MRHWLRILLVLCAGLPGAALAWGEQGHRITGHVARALLTPQALAGVRVLLGNTDLAAASLYLDQHKTELANTIRGSREWHYDDRPVCDADAPKAGWCPGGNCASTQILRQYRALIDVHASRPEKRLALRALVHLVGDVHQPLHASDHDDRGGNDVRVHFRINNRPRSSNLHSAWDTEFVEAAFDTSDTRLIAQRLLQARDPTEIKSWQKGSAAAWMKESFAISKDLTYGQLPAFACGTEDFANAPLDLDDSYVTQARELIPTQLVKAGARIAYLLNRAFAQ